MNKMHEVIYASPRRVKFHTPLKISVVIPCYNAKRYVAAALTSVFEQGWPDIEVIVVDDGSTDGSASLISRDFPGVTLITQQNQGVASARNLGIRRARGDWIAFLDADDVWLPGKLAAQQQALVEQPDARVCYCAWQIWNSSDPEPTSVLLKELGAFSDKSSRWGGPSGWIYSDLLLGCAVWTSTVLAHRSVFEEVGVFDTALRVGEDYDLWLRASRVTKIVRVSKPLALYRMHSESITRRVPQDNYEAIVIAKAIARWGYHGPDGTTARSADVDETLARTWRDFANANLLAGNFTGARQAAIKALRIKPFRIQAWSVFAKSLWGWLLSNNKRIRTSAERRNRSC